MSVVRRIPRIGRSLEAGSGQIFTRHASTKAELKYLQDVLKEKEAHLPENITVLPSHKDVANKTSQENQPRLDFTNRDILSLKTNLSLLDSCQKGLSTTCFMSSRWRYLVGHVDPQKKLEAKLSEIHKKQDTLLYMTSHNGLLQTALQRLPVAEAEVFVVHDGKCDLSVFPRQITSDGTHKRREDHQEPVRCTFIEKGDYKGLREELSTSNGKWNIVQTYGDCSAASTRDHTKSVQKMLKESSSFQLFRDVEEMSIMSHILGEGNALTETLSSPTLVQSSLGLISPMYEVRYVSGSWSVIGWLRQQLERSRMSTNVPMHVTQPILHTLSNTQHAYVQGQLYRSLENTLSLRRHLVELPCTVKGDTFTTVLDVPNRDVLRLILKKLQENMIAVSLDRNATTERTELKITAHANHTKADVERVASTLTDAFTAHAQGLERM